MPAQDPYRAVGSRLDVYGPGEVNQKPGVKATLVLISDDGTKGIFDNPPAGLGEQVSDALAQNIDVTFELRGTGSEIGRLTINREEIPLR